MGEPTQSPRTLRVHQVRSTNYLDQDAVLIHDDYESADMLTVAANVDWSRVIDVRGYETIHLLVDYTRGNSTKLFIAVEASWQTADVADEWFERTTLSGVTITDGSPLSFTPPGAGQFLLAIEVPVLGSYMRIKPYAETSGVNARCKIQAIRRMLAM
ncbi:MAG: hypothetical protein KKB59_18690 [Spirochaetes bacterium]|nr:hypothetical protein [Spirochaetota bacterium]